MEKSRAFKEEDIQFKFLEAYSSSTGDDNKRKIVELFRSLYRESVGEMDDKDIHALLNGATMRDKHGNQTKILKVLKFRVGRSGIGVVVTPPLPGLPV